MKKINTLTIIGLLAVSSLLSSCSVIGGIFKAGMGFGIFLVFLVVALVVFFLVKARKK